MEKNILFIIISISIAILLISVSIALYLSLYKKKLPETFDCYILSIFWTPHSCETKNSQNYECYQKIKSLGIEKYFTIHGLWPSTLEGTVPPACNEGMENTIVPNFDDDKNYLDKMEHYWPGLYSNNTYLWTHEYNKHGYCYMKRHYLNFVDDYKIYFDKIIKMFESGFRDLMENILPDSRGVYNVSKTKFKTLIKNSNLNFPDNKTYCLMCDEKTNLLTEIYFIYDLNYEPIRQKIHQENCPDYFILNFTDETKIPVWDKYDIYAFAVQYSPNICVWKGDSCYDILKKKENYKIGIHGLWPNYKSGIIPQDCNLGEDIEIKIKDNQEYFDNYILKYWYSLYNSDDYFLTHEYNKHGYCYNLYMNESIYNYEFYLNKTLEIFDKFNFASMLNNIVDNLTPGEHEINKEDIINELEKIYPKNSFVLTCYNTNDRLYLNEIYFKLDKNFELIDDANLKDTCQVEKVWINVIERMN